jgi:hypothetical protein
MLTQGDATPLFEEAGARRVAATHAVAVNSATSALHIACLALGLEPGDRLWTPPTLSSLRPMRVALRSRRRLRRYRLQDLLDGSRGARGKTRRRRASGPAPENCNACAFCRSELGHGAHRGAGSPLRPDDERSSLKDEDGRPLSVPRRPSCGRSISMTQLSGLMMAEQQAAAAERPAKFPSPRV